MAFTDFPLPKDSKRVTDSTSTASVRQVLTTGQRIIGTISSVSGAFASLSGWLNSWGETILTFPGLQAFVYTFGISFFTLSAIALNWQWFRKHYPSQAEQREALSKQFKALAPGLKRMLQQGPHNRYDLYWAKEHLAACNISCPKILPRHLVTKPDVVETEKKEWRTFLFHIAPLAELGDFEKARESNPL